MKTMTLLRTATLTLALFSSAAMAEIITADRVIAIVNRNAITQVELNQKINSIRKNLEQQKVQLPPEQVLQEQVLERMILDQLQTQYAQQLGIRVDDNQLEMAINRIAGQNQMSLPVFRKKLEETGMSWRGFRDQIRQEMLLARLKDREIDSKVVVTESEIDDYLKLAANKEQMEYNLAQIFIPLPENAAPDQIQARRLRIQAAKKELETGAAFASVAASYSADQNANSGGALGWRPAGSLPPAFTSLLDQLNPGGITDIVRSPAGFHLFKLLDKRSQQEQVVVDQSHVRHILIRSNEITSTTDAQQKLRQIRGRIEHGEKFEDLAKAFSDDASAPKGGDLGWLNPGETVPEFENAMNALKLGEVSQPIQTPFGFHLIRVDERRKQDVTLERARFKLRNELKQRKAEEQYDDWLRQLRDRAHVQLRLKDE
ncbi:peptidylprolyl isomerase [Deefgea salmonis]|uniref:Chaperone SurA n=1 Tax=Deefgea salmonis TaxID=2875502 RepID=A0ABS8BLU6_9NEIS|nr:peptidylprolyl isomerase [Deefgea salmonis]MCB5196713.1 peptidylprolyl isomerase [Deefgea salmonis]